jgi:hypothetical protein
MVSYILSIYFVFISLDVFNIFHKIFDHLKKFILYTFYVILTPSTHGDFIAYVSLLGSYGVWTRFPSSFVVDMFSKHNVYVVPKK